MKPKVLVFLIGGFLLGLLCFPSSGPSQKSITVTDAGGRTITVPLPVRSIVVLSGDAMEVVRILDAQDRVVGITGTLAVENHFWPELRGRTVVGKWNEPNYEIIAELNPDLVLCYTQNPGKEAEEKLNALGITLLRLDFFRLSTLIEEVETLGKVLGKESEAERFIRWYREKIELISRNLSGVKEPPRVFVENYSDFKTVGPGSGGNEICNLAGGRNIASDMNVPYAEITSEWVVERDPEVIVKMSSLPDAYGAENTDRLQKMRNVLLSRPVWNETEAVKKGRVYILEGDISAGPRAIIGALYMAKWFYPDRMTSFDPETFHREYLENFHKLPYRGLYVYPER